MKTQNYSFTNFNKNTENDFFPVTGNLYDFIHHIKYYHLL
jgi:hypothetical protein